MFAGAHISGFGADHVGGGRAMMQHSATPRADTTKEQMKVKFGKWGIDLKWVVLFPHVDDFNGREAGHNFLGSVSRTVVVHDNGDDHRSCVTTKRRETLTFCQRKVNEDTEKREACAGSIHRRILRWRESLPKQRACDIEQIANRIHGVLKDDLVYLATHENKCMYYSILCSNHRHVAAHFNLGLYQQVEALACLVHCNGPDK
jgi:hypothetical protein